MKTPLRAFQDALIVRNVVARVMDRNAMEHSSPEELKQYLHDHPDADPKNHKVKKDKGSGGSKGSDAVAEAESKKSQARSDEGNKHFDEMKNLKKKVDNADSSAKKKFDKSYDKLFEGGESAAKSAEKLVKQYDNIGDGLKGEDKKQREAAVEMVHHALRDWNSNKMKHLQGKGSMAQSKLEQAEQTHAYAQVLEKAIRGVSRTLKGDYTLER